MCCRHVSGCGHPKNAAALGAVCSSLDNAARYGQYLFRAQHRVTVALAMASLYTLHGMPPADGKISGAHSTHVDLYL